MARVSDFEITPEERRAINTLVRLARRWPENLMLHAGYGQIIVTRRDRDDCDRFLSLDAPEIWISAVGGDPEWTEEYMAADYNVETAVSETGGDHAC